MTQFTREDIIAKKHLGNGAYLMLVSPIAIEISPQKIILYIHLLKENAREVETIAFKITQD